MDWIIHTRLLLGFYIHAELFPSPKFTSTTIVVYSPHVMFQLDYYSTITAVSLQRDFPNSMLQLALGAIPCITDRGSLHPDVLPRGY